MPYLYLSFFFFKFYLTKLKTFWTFHKWNYKSRFPEVWPTRKNQLTPLSGSQLFNSGHMSLLIVGMMFEFPSGTKFHPSKSSPSAAAEMCWGEWSTPAGGSSLAWQGPQEPVISNWLFIDADKGLPHPHTKGQNDQRVQGKEQEPNDGAIFPTSN